MSMRMRPILYDKGYREVIGSDIHAGEQNVKAAVGTSAAKGNFVPLCRRSPAGLVLISFASAASVGSEPIVLKNSAP
jgi:hypothetical protein